MTADSPLSEFQYKAWNTTHPKCPRPCHVPAPGSWCQNAVAPTLWHPTPGAPMNIKDWAGGGGGGGGCFFFFGGGVCFFFGWVFE